MTDDEQMDLFCQEIGKLILWCNMIDHQLNQAVIQLFVLPNEVMVEAVVAQLDLRQKLELLKVRAKLLPPENEWRRQLCGWLKQVEKVNERRNIVAHHRVEVRQAKMVLASTQLIKIMKSVDGNLKPKPKSELASLFEWTTHASKTFAAGQTVNENLGRFYDRIREKCASKG